MDTAVRPAVGFSSETSLKLPEEGLSAKVGRDWVHKKIAEHPFPLSKSRLDDAVICTSELITNALRHAKTPCQVDVTWTGDSWEIAVEDGLVGRWVSAPESASVAALWESSRGLWLIALLADAWGVRASKRLGTKVVWVSFEESERGECVEQQCIPGQR